MIGWLVRLYVVIVRALQNRRSRVHSDGQRQSESAGQRVIARYLKLVGCDSRHVDRAELEIAIRACLGGRLKSTSVGEFSAKCQTFYQSPSMGCEGRLHATPINPHYVVLSWKRVLKY
jgi:hypothetical protein